MSQLARVGAVQERGRWNQDTIETVCCQCVVFMGRLAAVCSPRLAGVHCPCGYVPVVQAFGCYAGDHLGGILLAPKWQVEMNKEA